MSHTQPLVETPRSPVGPDVDTSKAVLPALYVPTEKLTEAALCDWIANALVGQSIQYHQGFLLMDRSESGSRLPNKDRYRLHSVARRAWIACELGLVHLFSVKVTDGHYRYLAVRSSTKVPRPEIRPRQSPVGTPSAELAPGTH